MQDSYQEVRELYEEYGIEELIYAYVSNSYAIDFILEHIKKEGEDIGI